LEGRIKMDNKQNQVLNILKSNGWYENRKIDISKILSFWEKQNYPITNSHIKVVEEFGFLKIEFNNHYIDINPLKKYISKETLKVLENLWGTELIPIGQILYEDSFILIGSNERIYGLRSLIVCLEIIFLNLFKIY
jgi:hypothetical protein